MEVVFNQDKKLIIAAANRCGSQHVARLARGNNGYRPYPIHSPFPMKIDISDFTLVTVVREPFARWRSWFFGFVFNNDDNIQHIEDWDIKTANCWLEDFDVLRHYDSHTGYQKILYEQWLKRIKLPKTAVCMNDIDMFLGLSNQRRVEIPNYLDFEKQMDHSVYEFLELRIKDMYKVDTDWINSLYVWKKPIDM